MSTVAQRMKVYRSRQRAGEMIVMVTVNENVVDQLIQSQFLEHEKAECRVSVASAIQRLLEFFATDGELR
jgi:hypothetical protein